MLDTRTDLYDPLDNLPEELKARRQWVSFRFSGPQKPTGKRDKIPYDPRTGQHASVSDPQSWVSYEEAVAVNQRSEYDGIGFVFTATDPYSGVDLDSCRDPRTGRLEPWAGEIVERVDSYTEASPSRTGVHILVKGTLPAGIGPPPTRKNCSGLCSKRAKV